VTAYGRHCVEIVLSYNTTIHEHEELGEESVPVPLYPPQLPD